MVVVFITSVTVLVRLCSILDKKNMSRNNVPVVFPAALPDSRNFALVYVNRLICIFLSGFTTV